MILAQQDDRQPDAVAYARKASERFETFLARGDATEKERSDIAGRFANMAQAHVNMHMYQEGIGYGKRTVELARSIPSAQRQAAQGLSLMANAYRYQGDLDAALVSIQEARKLADQATSTSETERSFLQYAILFREGLILGDYDGPNLGRPKEGIGALQKAVDMMEEGARKDPNDSATRVRLASAAIPLGDMLRGENDPKRALAAYDLALERLGEVHNNPPARQDQIKALATSSYALRSLHQAPEAKRRINQALAWLPKTKDGLVEQFSISSYAFTVSCAQADQEGESGDGKRAVELYEKLLDRVMASQPDHLRDLRDAPRMSRLYAAMAGLYLRLGAATKARDFEARRVEMWQSWDRKLPGNAFVRRQLDAAR